MHDTCYQMCVTHWEVSDIIHWHQDENLRNIFWSVHHLLGSWSFFAVIASTEFKNAVSNIRCEYRHSKMIINRGSLYLNAGAYDVTMKIHCFNAIHSFASLAAAGITVSETESWEQQFKWFKCCRTLISSDPGNYCRNGSYGSWVIVIVAAVKIAIVAIVAVTIGTALWLLSGGANAVAVQVRSIAQHLKVYSNACKPERTIMSYYSGPACEFYGESLKIPVSYIMLRLWVAAPEALVSCHLQDWCRRARRGKATDRRPGFVR